MRAIELAKLRESGRHLFRDDCIDLRTKRGKGVYSELYGVRCGVQCRNCQWRGYRKLSFLLDLRDGMKKFDAVQITSMIKGVPSFETCSRCGGRGFGMHSMDPREREKRNQSPVVFTHVPRRNRR